MRKLIVREFLSLDGVIQGPGGPDEDTSGDFRLGGWVAPFRDEGTSEDLEALLRQPFELLLGRRTYDIFSSYWPHVDEKSPAHDLATLFNRVRKHVATHRPDSLDWQQSHSLGSDLVSAVRALKVDAGPDLVTFGSGDMVRQLLRAGLVDELRLLIYPVVLGRGRRLFSEDLPPSAFSVAHSMSTPSGILFARYVPGGEVRTGSFD